MDWRSLINTLYTWPYDHTENVEPGTVYPTDDTILYVSVHRCDQCRLFSTGVTPSREFLFKYLYHPENPNYGAPQQCADCARANGPKGYFL